MSASKASYIKEQIKQHYTYEGTLQFNTMDLIQYLICNKVDISLKSLFEQTGFDLSDDSSLCVMHYDDDSVLILGRSIFIARNG